MAHEERDKAFDEWDKGRNMGIPELRHRDAGVREAFNAGWLARKNAEYRRIYKIKKLFP